MHCLSLHFTLTSHILVLLKYSKIMQVIRIKELQTNPRKLTKAFQNNDCLPITKHAQHLELRSTTLHTRVKTHSLVNPQF